MTKLSDLIQTLNGMSLRVRTGLWLLPAAFIGHEPAEAATYGIDAVDLRSEYVTHLDPTTNFADLNPNRVMSAVERVLNEPGQTRTVLIYNLDLLFSNLDDTERGIVWEKLYQTIAYRPRAALFAYPETAAETLPKPNELEKWRQDGRLAELAG